MVRIREFPIRERLISNQAHGGRPALAAAIRPESLQALLESDRIHTSRYRTVSQLGSWLVHGRFRLVLSFLRLRRSKDIDWPSQADSALANHIRAGQGSR